MKLHEFTTLLKNHPGKSFQLVLPLGKAIPVSFHITEVGRMQKTFLDCGGRLHESETCQLQVWLGEDEDHRIATGKMSDIFDKARSFLVDENVPVEIEYEDQVISQYTVENHSIAKDAIIFHLAHKHTACLAPELCMPASSNDHKTSETCRPGSGCC